MDAPEDIVLAEVSYILQTRMRTPPTVGASIVEAVELMKEDAQRLLALKDMVFEVLERLSQAVESIESEAEDILE